MTAFEHVYFSYGTGNVLEDFSWLFAAGSVTAVCGASGAGKTTLLKLIAGLKKPSSGKVFAESPAAVMFQEPRLLPWFTAERNLTAVLGKGSEETARKWLAAVRLEKDAGSLPEALSGGMRQRLSLARTLAYAETGRAPLVLLDEPFSALDPSLHAEMRELTLRTLKGRTVILVTHSEDDAKAADFILHLPRTSPEPQRQFF